LAQDPRSLARDRALFERTINALEAEIANVGAHLTIDATTRQVYAQQIHSMASEMRTKARNGRITWADAAQEAQEERNAIMEVIRGRCTPVGRALAESMKRHGKTLNDLVGAKTLSLYGSDAKFEALSTVQRDAVYAEIVKSSGRSNLVVTSRMRTLSRAGRSLLVLSIALSVYSIATAEDKLDTTGRELSVTGAGIGGGIAGGALAGLACGPGAPLCVTVGTFVGGAFAGFGIDYLW